MSPAIFVFDKASGKNVLCSTRMVAEREAKGENIPEEVYAAVKRLNQSMPTKEELLRMAARTTDAREASKNANRSKRTAGGANKAARPQSEKQAPSHTNQSDGSRASDKSTDNAGHAANLTIAPVSFGGKGCAPKSEGDGDRAAHKSTTDAGHTGNATTAPIETPDKDLAAVQEAWQDHDLARSMQHSNHVSTNISTNISSSSHILPSSEPRRSARRNNNSEARRNARRDNAFGSINAPKDEDDEYDPAKSPDGLEGEKTACSIDEEKLDGEADSTRGCGEQHLRVVTTDEMFKPADNIKESAKEGTESDVPEDDSDWDPYKVCSAAGEDSSEKADNTRDGEEQGSRVVADSKVPDPADMTKEETAKYDAESIAATDDSDWDPYS